MEVEFYAGGYSRVEEFPDDTSEDYIQQAFDAWLENRSDIGWTILTSATDERKL